MSRVMPFILAVGISAEWLRDDPKMAEEMARDILFDKSDNLVGPRGGRYLPIGEPRDIRLAAIGDDFILNRQTLTARIDGRYVRPKRSA